MIEFSIPRTRTDQSSSSDAVAAINRIPIDGMPCYTPNSKPFRPSPRIPVEVVAYGKDGGEQKKGEWFLLPKNLPTWFDDCQASTSTHVRVQYVYVEELGTAYTWTGLCTFLFNVFYRGK